MNLKALRVFRQIVLTGSLAEASRTLNVSPPAASRLLTLLEAEIGITLFHRDRRELRLTDAGDLFYRRILHTLDGLEDFQRVASEIKQQTHKSLSIVTAAPMANTIVAPALARMQQTDPDFRCALNVETRFNIESRVAARGFSVGLVSLPVENAILEMVVEPFIKVRQEVLLPEGHALADKAMLCTDDIKDEAFIGLQAGQRWRNRLDRMMLSVGRTANISFETSSTLVALQMVREGMGLALIDRATIHLNPAQGLVLRPLADEEWTTYAYLHAKGPRSYLSDEFVTAVRAVIRARIETDPQEKHSVKLL